MFVKYRVNSGVVEVGDKVFMSPQVSVKSTAPLTGVISSQKLLIEGVLPENFKVIDEVETLTLEGIQLDLESTEIFEKFNVETDRLSGYSKPLIIYLGGTKRLEVKVNNKYVFHTIEANIKLEKRTYVLNVLATPVKMIWMYIGEGYIDMANDLLKASINVT